MRRIPLVAALLATVTAVAWFLPPLPTSVVIGGGFVAVTCALLAVTAPRKSHQK